jgi:MOSC domain-containing protein YiiM
VVSSVTTDRDFEPSLADVRAAPRDAGRLVLIVRRPNVDEREILGEAVLDTTVGLVGDGWSERGSSRTPDGGPNPESQVTVISTRVLRAIEPDETRWPLAGDQLYVDFDLGQEELPPGSRIAVGSAVLVVSDQPHTGCAKFSARFGSDALRWINSPVGRELRMRGMNTRVIEGGTIRTGDAVRRV